MEKGTRRNTKKKKRKIKNRKKGIGETWRVVERHAQFHIVYFFLKSDFCEIMFIKYNKKPFA